MPAKPTFEDRTLIDLLIQFDGNIQECKKALGVKSSQTIYSRIDRNPVIKTIWEKIQQKQDLNGNLLGKRFGSRTVIAKTRQGRQGHQYWLCRCDCGNEKEITGSYLLQGRSHKCLECTIVKHGMYKTPEYKAWLKIIQRCANPNDPEYHNYGGRGITIWEGYRHDFEAFLKEVGSRPSPHHSIDRIINSKGYEPGNLRWATAKEQTNNRRLTLQVDGVQVSCHDLSSKLGLNREVIRRLIKQGFTMVDLEAYSKIPKDDWHGLRNFPKNRGLSTESSQL